MNSLLCEHAKMAEMVKQIVCNASLGQGSLPTNPANHCELLSKVLTTDIGFYGGSVLGGFSSLTRKRKILKCHLTLIYLRFASLGLICAHWFNRGSSPHGALSLIY